MELTINEEATINGSTEITALCLKDGKLSGMIRCRLLQNSDIAYIIDITSAQAFRLIADKTSSFRQRFGVAMDISPEDTSGMECLDEFIGAMLKDYPNVNMIVIRTLESNRIALENDIFGYFPKFSSHISKVTGGGEDYAATLYPDKMSS